MYARRVIRKINSIGRIHEVSQATLESLADNERKCSNIVVSLTSYGDRINKVHLSIKSIMMQSLAPKEIVLYLDKDSDDVPLTHSLECLKEHGLRIVRGVDNIKSHKKYHYAMLEYPEDCIITIDDDVIYDNDVLESLYCSYIKYPNCISARRAHRIKVVNGRVAPYSEWHHEWREKSPCPRKSLFAVGVGGVLYSPHILCDTAFDKELKMRLCPNADDVWLKVMEALTGVGTVWVPNKNAHPYSIKGLHETPLYISNALEGGNDEQLRRAMGYFGLSADAFIDNQEG